MYYLQTEEGNYVTKEQAIAEAARQSATDGYSRYCHYYARRDLLVLPPDLRGMPVDSRDSNIVPMEKPT